MVGLQNSSSNLKSIRSHVVDSTRKFLDAYKSSHSVSNETITKLSDDVLQSADEAFRLAKQASGGSSKIAEAAQADFKRYLAAQGFVVTRSVEAPTPTPAPVVQPPEPKVARQKSGRQPAAYKAPAPLARKAPTPPAPAPKVRAKAPGRPRKMRPMLNGHELPRGLKAAEDAITMKGIVCFEDGKRVKDLASHLMSLNITPSQYRAKWGLSEAYPMHAPQLILQKGATYDIDYATGVRRRVRSI